MSYLLGWGVPLGNFWAVQCCYESCGGTNRDGTRERVGGGGEHMNVTGVHGRNPPSTTPPSHYTLPYHPTSPLHPPIPPHLTTTPPIPPHLTTTPSHTTHPSHETLEPLFHCALLFVHVTMATQFMLMHVPHH